MILKHLINLYDIIEKRNASAVKVKEYLDSILKTDIQITTLGDEATTDVIQIYIKGKEQKRKPIAILGRLGGVGARESALGLVSDADGALAALTVAAEILELKSYGDNLDLDIYISTHICPNAPTLKHNPVDFMSSPISIEEINKKELVEYDIDPGIVFSVDTTKGNRIINTKGFSITPTVKEGYILKVNPILLNIMEWTSGKLPSVLPITTQDITPYDNGIYHINSIMQPATVTNAPVIGVAITTESTVPGCMTGASHFGDIENTARFLVEICKYYSKNEDEYYDKEEFDRLKELYGSLDKFKLK